MKAAFFLLQLTAVMAGMINQRNTPGCDSDNCARAVTGTRLGPASVSAHQADCSSFMQVTTYVGVGAVTPTATPAYASACAGPGDSYSSACSCWGIAVKTVTLYADDAGADDAWHP